MAATGTTLIVCCSPAEADLSETLSTLRFGARARKVRNFAKVNAVVDVTALAEQLQASPRRVTTAATRQSGAVAEGEPCALRGACDARAALAVKLRMARREAEGLREEQGSLQQRNVRNYETTEAAEAAAARGGGGRAAPGEQSEGGGGGGARGGGGAAEAPLRSQAGRLKESEMRADAERRAEAAAAAAAEKLRAGDAAHAATLAEHEVD